MTGGHGVARLDGRRIHYRRAGVDGPTVVLLHGGGVDDAELSWKLTIEELADAGYQVYAPDWPGYGESDPHPEPSIDTYVEILDEFLDALALDTVSLVGISMGGAAALGYTLDHSERVEKLTLVDSYGLGSTVPAGSLWYTLAHIPGANAAGWSMMGTSREATAFGLGNVVHDPNAVPGTFVSDVRERASETGAGRAFTRFQRNEIGPGGRVKTNYASDLDELDIPVLLVHGEGDPLFPVHWARRAHEDIADSALVVFEHCGHWSPREKPLRFNTNLVEFLRTGTEFDPN
ncbi:alpha/beta fold hydrolase [Haloarchaeobius sp. HME9146]|uniref:alpha/beta fold hydrolase n=1 Tax=Haloarchaeobius sp. HME9146 TaxID=2978732 RepID=UPI0021C0B638|nr:alpha/beta hydrolase [Haloarchaeobius sp. HME9146]MCT9096890.1 alpha/beta hydrolase [Haloarchaeobius sp. HME9146]